MYRAVKARVTHLDPIHDLGELELESDLEKPLVLADGVGDAGLDSIAADQSSNPVGGLRSNVGLQVVKCQNVEKLLKMSTS
jgi:hypothetical protein